MEHDIHTFCRIFGVPEFLNDWIDRFFEPLEIDLVLLLGEGPLNAATIGDQLGCAIQVEIQGFLDRAVQRGILNRLPDGRYGLAGFHARFEIWALLEGWKDIPPHLRSALNAWELDHYENLHGQGIRALRSGEPIRPDRIWPRYLLLDEALELMDRVEHIYLWPCNCRSMMERCEKPVLTCLRFSNDRGIGWEISAERAKEIIREANRKGLMQSGETGLDAEGNITGALCNCCADCCYPHLLADRLDAAGYFPLSRYVARHLTEACTGCGRCFKRCPFKAFRMVPPEPGEGRPKKPKVGLDPNLCRGCGLCATGCPENAIEMVLLDKRSAES
jgi:ferredoxin